MQTWLKIFYRHDPKAWETCLFLSNICWENPLYLSMDLFWHLRPNFPRFSFSFSSFLPIFPVSPLKWCSSLSFLPVSGSESRQQGLPWQVPNEAYMCQECLPVLVTATSLPVIVPDSFEREHVMEWLWNQLSFAALNVEPLRALKFQLNFWVWRKLSL